MKKRLSTLLAASMVCGLVLAQSFPGKLLAQNATTKGGAGADDSASHAKGQSGAKKSKGPTEINASESSFDQNAHVAVFTGSVIVKDPDFNLFCDKLTAYLKHNEKKAGAANTTAGKGASAGRGGLEKAVAITTSQQRVIITQDKKDTEGHVITRNYSIGKADQATFDEATGNTVLTGNPEITQGASRCISTSPETVMVLNRDGHMTANGPHQTVLIDEAEPVYSGSEIKVSKAVGRSEAIVRGVLSKLGTKEDGPPGMAFYMGTEFKVTKRLTGSCNDVVSLKLVVVDHDQIHERIPEIGNEYIVFIAPEIGQEKVAVKILPDNEKTVSEVAAAAAVAR